VRILSGRRSPIAGALFLFSAACADLGPDSSSYAAVAIAPTFSRDAVALYRAANLADVPIDNARLRLTRIGGGVARDVTIPIAPAQDSLVIDMNVAITGPSELLTALLELRHGTQVIFSGVGVVLAVAGGSPSVPVIPMVYVGPVDAVVSKLVLVTTGLTGIVGQLLGQPLTVQTLTADDAPVAGVPIAWSVLGGGAVLGNSTSVTDASGFASTPVTLGTLAGTQTIQAAANGVTPISATLAALAGPAAGLEILQQPASLALLGVALATQPIVRLVDQFGNASATPNVPVIASLVGSGITLGGSSSALTNASGVASFSGLTLTGLLGSTAMLFSGSGLASATSNPITLGILPSVSERPWRRQAR
jgi:hypothetical protein